MNEKDIIEYFISQQQCDSVAYGIGDDCAILNPTPGCQLVTTTDTMIEGRHFVKQAPAYAVGYKLMAVNLSDIAAMGAIPKWATLNLSLRQFDQAWIKDFSNGLLECANKHNVTIVGGDTTRGDQLILSLQLLGEIPLGSATLRNQAQINDVIYVTGTIGCAAAALRILEENKFLHSALNQTQTSALYMPPSRVELAQALREYIRASIDISDGLLHELEIICHQSHVGAILMLENIPVSKDMDVMQSITAGDDYELLFTADVQYVETIAELASSHHCAITAIGNIVNSQGIKLTMNQQEVTYPNISGYDHFLDNHE